MMSIRPSHVVRLADDALDRCRRRASRTRTRTADAPATLSTALDAGCTPAQTCGPTGDNSG
jgi:hypothetical protein